MNIVILQKERSICNLLKIDFWVYVSLLFGTVFFWTITGSTELDINHCSNAKVDTEISKSAEREGRNWQRVIPPTKDLIFEGIYSRFFFFGAFFCKNVRNSSLICRSNSGERVHIEIWKKMTFLRCTGIQFKGVLDFLSSASDRHSIETRNSWWRRVHTSQAHESTSFDEDFRECLVIENTLKKYFLMTRSFRLY